MSYLERQEIYKSGTFGHMVKQSETTTPINSSIRPLYQILTTMGALDIIHGLKPSDYTISTWLILGATIQCILLAALPRNIALLPPFALLVFRILQGYLTANGTLHNPKKDAVLQGRGTWQIPNVDGSESETGSAESIVVLVLAASWSHPNGKYSPGSADIGKYFKNMWKDAEENRELYGFLGNTPQLSTQDDGERQDSKGQTEVTLSYWKTLEGLHKFAHASAHMKGQLWWERGASEDYPHIGIMHEVYDVPAGNWENIYQNFRPFGVRKLASCRFGMELWLIELVNAQYPVSVAGEETTGIKEKETTRWMSGLRGAEGKNWKTMHSRMGRKTVFGALKTT